MNSPNAKRYTFQTYYRGKVCPVGGWGAEDLRIIKIILLNEKFLPFDWLRAEVFQLDLKYLHVKITVTMVTQNHQIISSHELRKIGGKISRFWNQEIQELKENLENQNTEKVHRPGSMSGPAGLKTRTSKPICSRTKRKNSTKIKTWR